MSNFSKEYLMNRPTLDPWIEEKIYQNFNQHDESEYDQLPRHHLERYQLDMINRTLALASEKSSFYNSLYGAVKIYSLPEMANLPFTTPEDLKENPYRMLCVHPNEIIRIVTLNTSGSTGVPKRVFFTEPDLELCTDYFHHGMRNLVNETDIVGILFPFQTPASVGDQLINGLGRLGAKTVPLLVSLRKKFQLP